MDDWVAILDVLGPFLTILATGAVTSVSVWLKGIYDSRNEKQRIDGQLQLAAEERARIEKADADTAKRAEDAEHRTLARQAVGDMSKFLGPLSRQNSDLWGRDLEEMWTTTYDARMREAIELVSDRQAHADLLAITNALAGEKRIHSLSDATQMVRVAIEIAGAVSRGDSYTPELRERLAALGL